MSNCVYRFPHGLSSLYGDINSIITDGRVASKYNEKIILPGIINGYIPEPGDAPGMDGRVGSRVYEVRSLTPRGIKFQRSQYQGKGRTCNQAQLLESICEKDCFLIVDITRPPMFGLTILPSEIVEKWVHNGFLTPSGLTPSKFWWLMNQTGHVVEKISDSLPRITI